MFFLPLFDNNPTGRTPLISWLILAVCVIVFLWQTGLSATDEYELFLGFGVVVFSAFFIFCKILGIEFNILFLSLSNSSKTPAFTKPSN